MRRVVKSNRTIGYPIASVTDEYGRELTVVQTDAWSQIAVPTSMVNDMDRVGVQIEVVGMIMKAIEYAFFFGFSPDDVLGMCSDMIALEKINAARRNPE